ncbi:MAG TPA: protein kinase, partial [Thermoanaerobaculia bacterium]|nr:protein kinase [Thermoanaerobaculia bacterium]
MGLVYLGKDPTIQRFVAIKTMRLDQIDEVKKPQETKSRFFREAESAGRLSHPNIVTIYDAGEQDELGYIAMELVEGNTVRELVAEGPMAVRRILSIAQQIAEGLAKAHAVGIVHRDLKPENVMVSKDGYVKILDFGLSKLVAPESGELSAMPTLARAETQPGTVLGTVAYMSPEQAGGRPVDYRSDQFSLGSILYEMAAGKKPFRGDTAAETMSTIIRDEPEPLAKVRPQTPPPLRWIVERCLAKDPEERYASTRDLARDLAGVRDRISEVGSGAEALPAAARRKAGPRAWLGLGALALLTAGIAAGWVASRGLRPPSSAPSFHRISFRPAAIGNARFAPDGQTVIYGILSGGKVKLHQTRLGSPESRAFDFPDADIFSISRSGEMAVLLGQNSRRPTLARVPLTGGVPREVLEGIRYSNADWGPDGKSLAVARSAGGRFRLEYPAVKVLFESDSIITAPRFSHDGREIAFLQSEDAGTSVAVIEASGGKPRVLSTGWFAAAGVPAWTPDGREVWFTASRAGQLSALYAVTRSGRLREVTRVPGDLELDDISPDGRVLVAHHTGLVTLMGMAPGESKERDLSWLDHSAPADLSRDGRTLVVSEEGEGGGPGGSVYLRPMDGSPPVRLGEGMPATLSPDGNWVVAKVFAAEGKPHLALLPTGAGEIRTLPNETLVTIGWVNWLPDGKTLLVSGSEPGHLNRLYVQEIAGGKPRAISPEGFRLRPQGNSVSPDGNLVAAIGGNRQILFCALQGGEPRPAPGAAPGDLPVEWSADGRSLYIYRRGENPARIFLLDLATGQK